MIDALVESFRALAILGRQPLDSFIYGCRARAIFGGQALDSFVSAPELLGNLIETTASLGR